MVKNKITQNQYTFIIFSSILAVGILSMASGLCKNAKQNGWIALFVGTLHPIIMLFCSIIIDKKTNHASIFETSKKIYGKILSYIFFSVFLLYFITILAGVLSGFTNILRITIATYLSPLHIMIPTIIIVLLISFLGVTMVGRISEFYFYITIPLVIIVFLLIPKGCISNVMPISLSLNELIKALPATLLAFAGSELSFFLIDKITGKRKPIRSAIFIIITICLIYVSNVFMIIYTLGWEVTSVLYYPLLFVIQTIEIPILSDFLSLVLLLWSILILKCLLTYNYVSSEILSNLTKINYKITCVIISIVGIIFTFFMIPSYNRDFILDKTLPYYVGFSLCWAIITTILVLIKYKEKKK